VTAQADGSDVSGRAAQRKAVLLTRIAEAAFVALLPIIAVWLLNVSIIDQESYADPAFYTGYGQSFERMWQVFGLTYYAARFPVMFLNTTTQQLVPGFGGYAVAHYIGFLAAAIPFYLLARQHFGRTVAAASYAFLLLNPLFPRVLSWDLTTSLSIPAGLSGIALWLLARRPWGISAFGAGFMFAVALNSHIFTGTAIGVFLATEFLFSLFRRRGVLAYIVQTLTATAGAVTCVLLGLWFYQATVGKVTPAELWEVTARAVGDGRVYAETHYVSLADYYAINYEIYVPLLTIGAAIVLNRKRVLRDTIDARISWFAVAYLCAYVVAVFVLRMNIVQYFWYFGHLTIAVYLTVPVVLRRIADHAGSGAILWFTGTLALISLTVSVAFRSVHQISVGAVGNGPVAFAILTLGALALALLSLRHRRALSAGAVLCAVVVQASYLSRTHLSVYDRAENAAERPLFEIIREYHRLLNRYDKPDTRVRTWYRTSNARLLSVASSNLLFTVQSPWDGPGLPHVGLAERRILIQEQTRYVLLMADDAERIDAGLHALTEAKVPFTPRETASWGYPPARVSVALIELVK
jgi:hypothetical protein